MKINKIEISCSKLITTHLLWAYLTIVGFNEIGHSTAAVVVTPRPTLPSSTSKPTVTSASYVRKSREISATSSPEAMDPGQEQFGGLSPSNTIHFPYPSFKHKYQTRMSRFHGGEGGPATRTYSIRSMTSLPKLSPLASMMTVKSSEVSRHPTVEEVAENESQDPTFTPFISARALSNIPQFFQHLRDNLEALQFDEDDDEENDENVERLLGALGQGGDGMYLYGNDEDPRMPNIPRPPEKPMRWMPVTAGMTGRAHVRHFVAANPEEQDLFYKKPAFFNPARNVYEFGLG